MSILDYILIFLGAVTVFPTLAFLIMKWGSVGFYRGKEVCERRNEFDSVSVQDNHENENES